MITWLIGLSGSGKTALTKSLYDHLKPTCRHLALVDGDEFRAVFRDDADHTVEGRRRNAARLSHFCRFLDGQDIHVVAAVLSIFPEWQAWNREHFSRYFEVFLDVPLDVVKARDTKGLYGGAIPNVVGLDIPFPRPANPDLIVDVAMQEKGVEACRDLILTRMPALT